MKTFLIDPIQSGNQKYLQENFICPYDIFRFPSLTCKAETVSPGFKRLCTSELVKLIIEKPGQIEEENEIITSERKNSKARKLSQMSDVRKTVFVKRLQTLRKRGGEGGVDMHTRWK